jgi:hypothetical protein
VDRSLRATGLGAESFSRGQLRCWLMVRLRPRSIAAAPRCRLAGPELSRGLVVARSAAVVLLEHLQPPYTQLVDLQFTDA